MSFATNGSEVLKKTSVGDPASNQPRPGVSAAAAIEPDIQFPVRSRLGQAELQKTSSYNIRCTCSASPFLKMTLPHLPAGASPPVRFTNPGL